MRSASPVFALKLPCLAALLVITSGCSHQNQRALQGTAEFVILVIYIFSAAAVLTSIGPVQPGSSVRLAAALSRYCLGRLAGRAVESGDGSPVGLDGNHAPSGERQASRRDRLARDHCHPGRDQHSQPLVGASRGPALWDTFSRPSSSRAGAARPGGLGFGGFLSTPT